VAVPRKTAEGWHGWDEYAPFYDWENARTLGRADVPFWRRVATGARGPVLELGCGTGRVSLPLARAGVDLIGVDRSPAMLERAAGRVRTIKARRGSRATGSLSLVRADIRALPFAAGHFRLVMAPYGILQSLIRDRDLTATLRSVADVLAKGGTFGLDLVPDVPNWREYKDRIQMRGRAAGGAHLTLIESVRQDPKGRLTTFEQKYVRRVGKSVTERSFELTFRTLPVKRMVQRLEKAGFGVDRVLGDYRGRPWDERADVWIILAKRL